MAGYGGGASVSVATRAFASRVAYAARLARRSGAAGRTAEAYSKALLDALGAQLRGRVADTAEPLVNVPVAASLARRVPPVVRGLALRRQEELESCCPCPYLGQAVARRAAAAGVSPADRTADRAVQQQRNAAEHSRFTPAELAGQGTWCPPLPRVGGTFAPGVVALLDKPLPLHATVYLVSDLEAQLRRRCRLAPPQRPPGL